MKIRSVIEYLNKVPPDTNSEQLKTLIEELKKLDPEGDVDQCIPQLTRELASGINGLYLLMNALCSAVAEDNQGAVGAIFGVFVELIEKTPDHSVLITGLRRPKEDSPYEPEPGAGTNGLYWLMHALSWAAVKDNRVVAGVISSTFVTLIEKMEDPAELIAGLSQENTERVSKGAFIGDGPNHGINALYWLMNALQQAAEKNNWDAVGAISNAFVKLIEKTKDSAELIEGLSKSKAGINGFYLWMNALQQAAAKDNQEAVSKISDALIKLIEKSKKYPVALINGLSLEKRKEPDAGTNGFYWLMNALQKAATTNNLDVVNNISKMLVTLANGTAYSMERLIAGLSQQKASDPDAYANGFYRLMDALNLAASYGKIEVVRALSVPLSLIIQKIQDTKKLADMLSQNWELLTNTFTKTLEYRPTNSEAIVNIFSVFLTLTNRCKTPRFGFFGGDTWMTEFKQSEKMGKIYNQFFDLLIEKDSKESPLFTPEQFQTLQKLFVETGGPKTYLKAYIQSREGLTAEHFSKETNLGKLVDSRRHAEFDKFFRREEKDTETRALVTKTLR